MHGCNGSKALAVHGWGTGGAWMGHLRGGAGRGLLLAGGASAKKEELVGPRSGHGDHAMHEARPRDALRRLRRGRRPRPRGEVEDGHVVEALRPKRCCQGPPTPQPPPLPSSRRDCVEHRFLHPTHPLGVPRGAGSYGRAVFVWQVVGGSPDPAEHHRAVPHNRHRVARPRRRVRAGRVRHRPPPAATARRAVRRRPGRVPAPPPLPAGARRASDAPLCVQNVHVVVVLLACAGCGAGA